MKKKNKKIKFNHLEERPVAQSSFLDKNLIGALLSDNADDQIKKYIESMKKPPKCIIKNI